MKVLALTLAAVLAAPLAGHAHVNLRDDVQPAQDLRRGDAEAPRDRRQAAPAAPAPAKPAAPVDEEAGRRKVLDELFDRLAKARDEEEGKGVAGAIERVMLRSGSDTADLLLTRARQAINSKDNDVAIQLLDKVVELEPRWAEAWRHRATARFMAGDRGGAVADLGQTLALEPRHFDALTGLGSILHATGFDRRALDVLRRAIEVHPQQPEVKALIEQLAPDVDGRDL